MKWNLVFEMDFQLAHKLYVMVSEAEVTLLYRQLIKERDHVTAELLYLYANYSQLA